MVAEQISRVPPERRFVSYGRVLAVSGLTLTVVGLKAAIGDLCWVVRRDKVRLPAQVEAFSPGGRLLLTSYQDVRGLEAGCLVFRSGRNLLMPVGPGLLGRVLDGLARPLDGGPPIDGSWRPIEPRPIAPLERLPVTEPLWTGIRVIDGLLTVGVGQRVGIFAGAGLGKTVLVRSILDGMSADVAVVALIGERGREIAEFYQSLAPSALRRSVLVAATSDSPAAMRVKAVDVASAAAEDFRDRGLSVVLVVDSLTRVAMARREVAVEAGELPSARGYTPSVFHLLPRILERAGRVGAGAITGLYTVLLDSDDPTDPIGDAVRGILDGNIYLSRELAERHHFPAVDVSRSLSRVMAQVVGGDHQRAARLARRVMADLGRSEQLVRTGLYQPGSDPALDRALLLQDDLRAWLIQAEGERSPAETMLGRLKAIVGEGEAEHA